MTGWTLGDAAAVSADGHIIAGTGVHNGNTEAWLAMLPEPGTPVLLALALLGLAARGVIRSPRAAGDRTSCRPS